MLCWWKNLGCHRRFLWKDIGTTLGCFECPCLHTRYGGIVSITSLEFEATINVRNTRTSKKITWHFLFTWNLCTSWDMTYLLFANIKIKMSHKTARKMKFTAHKRRWCSTKPICTKLVTEITSNYCGRFRDFWPAPAPRRRSSDRAAAVRYTTPYRGCSKTFEKKLQTVKRGGDWWENLDDASCLLHFVYRCQQKNLWI